MRDCMRWAVSPTLLTKHELRRDSQLGGALITLRAPIYRQALLVVVVLHQSITRHDRQIGGDDSGDDDN